MTPRAPSYLMPIGSPATLPIHIFVFASAMHFGWGWPELSPNLLSKHEGCQPHHQAQACLLCLTYVAQLEGSQVYHQWPACAEQRFQHFGSPCSDSGRMCRMVGQPMRTREPLQLVVHGHDGNVFGKCVHLHVVAPRESQPLRAVLCLSED